MSYSTISDLQNRVSPDTLIQLTDDTGSGEIDSPKINSAISWADEIIDGYIRGRYTLPLAQTPGLIKNLSTELAVYWLYSRRMTTEIPESITAIYKDSLKILSDIQTGRVSIGVYEVQTPKASADYVSRTTMSNQFFTKEVLDNF
ncbi:MAG TPA: DUF1320 domain-containing protein [Candidatus Gastranaerophilales bacterium]|nr:DUF1320 domain-containing protein [Candidatus Gastranaerophilales bacterium]